MSQSVKEVDADDFKKIINGGKAVLADFWAPWCGPCKAIAPYIEQIAGELHGQAEFLKVNIDDNMELAEEYQVSSIPTIMIFKNGKPVEKSVGMRPKAALQEMISKHI